GDRGAAGRPGLRARGDRRAAGGGGGRIRGGDATRACSSRAGAAGGNGGGTARFVAWLASGLNRAPRAKGNAMPLFMDVHDTIPEDADAAAVAAAHQADLDVQEKYGVQYLHYWLDE